MQPMHRGEEPAPEAEPPYWTHDARLFNGRFKYFSRELEPVEVRGKIHLSEEPYRLSTPERDTEPIAHLAGTRTYVHMKPYVQTPDIVLTIGLYATSTDQGAIGEVLKAQERKHKEVEIGQAQAWYYPQDKTIVLWECLLHSFVQDAPLLEDQNMLDYWRNFERFLQQQFSQAEQLTTPYHDPEYEFTEYQEFLATLGYQPHPTARAAWSKAISSL